MMRDVLDPQNHRPSAVMWPLGRTRLMILLAVIERPRGLPPTIRELAEWLGIHITAVANHLHALRRDGLVTWEGTGRRSGSQARTLRATCRWVPASALDAEGRR